MEATARWFDRDPGMNYRMHKHKQPRFCQTPEQQLENFPFWSIMTWDDDQRAQKVGHKNRRPPTTFIDEKGGTLIP